MVGCGVVVAYAPRCASLSPNGLACEASNLWHVEDPALVFGYLFLRSYFTPYSSFKSYFSNVFFFVPE